MWLLAVAPGRAHLANVAEAAGESSPQHASALKGQGLEGLPRRGRQRGREFGNPLRVQDRGGEFLCGLLCVAGAQFHPP